MRRLATADRMLSDGKDIAAVCRELQVSEQTYYRWRKGLGHLQHGVDLLVEHMFEYDEVECEGLGFDRLSGNSLNVRREGVRT